MAKTSNINIEELVNLVKHFVDCEIQDSVGRVYSSSCKKHEVYEAANRVNDMIEQAIQQVVDDAIKQIEQKADSCFRIGIIYKNGDVKLSTKKYEFLSNAHDAASSVKDKIGQDVAVCDGLGKVLFKV